MDIIVDSGHYFSDALSENGGMISLFQVLRVRHGQNYKAEHVTETEAEQAH